MFGFINFNKPCGLTSRDCVNIVSRNLKTRKVGHAGTLDPIAQGVLVIAVGKATRLIEYVQQQRKRYRGTFQLGLESPSWDIETQTTPVFENITPSRESLEAACAAIVGRIEQRPPIYSAVKIGGQRAYDLARRGVDIEMPARMVDIYSCELVSYNYPMMELLIECGSGTYVRSLGRDIAVAVGSSAIMTQLTREAIGVFERTTAIDRSAFEPTEPQTDRLLPIELAIAMMAQAIVTNAQCEDLQHGRAITLDAYSSDCPIAVLDEDRKLISIAEYKDGLWKPAKNFSQAD